MSVATSPETPQNGCPNLVPLQTVQNYEFGFKIQNQWTYVDASVYDKEFQGMRIRPRISVASRSARLPPLDRHPGEGDSSAA